MRRIALSSVTYPALQNYSTLSHGRHDHRKKITEHKMCVLWFPLRDSPASIYFIPTRKWNWNRGFRNVGISTTDAGESPRRKHMALRTWREFEIKHKMCVSASLQILSEIFLILRRIQRDIIINIHWSSCKVAVILIRLQWNLSIFARFSKNTLISKLMKFCSEEVELFHAEGQTEGQTDKQPDGQIDGRTDTWRS
jgi:hypothetical protein